MEHEWYSGELMLTMKKDEKEDSSMIIRLYKIELVVDSENENMGTLRKVILKGLKLDYRCDDLKDYGKSERDQYYNLVKKNYLSSYIVGRELSGFMEAFVEEVPYWDYERKELMTDSD